MCPTTPPATPVIYAVHGDAQSDEVDKEEDDDDDNGHDDAIFDAYNANVDANVHFCTTGEGMDKPPGGPKPSTHPTHRYAYDDADKDQTTKYDLDDDVFNPMGKTSAFLIVFINLSCSTFKDDKLEENNYDNDFQSEGKNHCFCLWFCDGGDFVCLHCKMAILNPKVKTNVF